MPFFSPLWSRCPRIVFLHHVHAEMWNMVLSPSLARVGYALEHRVAPPFYRRSQIVTLSASARDDLVDRLHFAPGRVTVVPPGIDARFAPGPAPDEDPLVVAVGRLVPVKRFDRFIDAMVILKQTQPRLQAMIVGEGYERPDLESRIASAGAEGWFTLPGRLSDEALVDTYRRAWVVASTSVREGWGMTLTEAAACGTPAVATRIAGHEDAVVDGESGLLVDSVQEMAEATESILANPMVRRRLSLGALRRAEQMTWERTAEVALQTLAAQVSRDR
jgi:glycosyltransferase involved in cell wall biosynthesis